MATRATVVLGVFDSGVGGLTVVRALQRELPDVPLLYLGDTARFPYGPKSAATMQRYSTENAAWLLERGARAVLIACHTASSVAAEELRRSLTPRGVPVFDVVGPGLDEALSVTHGHIGILGTRGTVASGAHERYLRARSATIKVTAQACPLLAPLVEEGMVDAPETRSILERYLAPVIDAGADTIILGCTHYPPLRPLIEELLPDGVQVVDPADAAAAHVADAVAREGLNLGDGQVRDARGSLKVYLTDSSAGLNVLGPTLLGRSLDAEVVAASQ